MINFPQDAKYTYIKGSKIVEETKKSLETTLRKLGNFNGEKPIEIFNYRNGATTLDTIYEVRDLDNTVFEFYNYGLDGGSGDVHRYSMNHHLTMKRENSRITYKYDFDEMDYGDYKQGLRIVELSCTLKKNRVLRIERRAYVPIKLIIEENAKKYIIVLHEYPKEDYTVFEELGEIIEKALKINELNLEKVLEIIDNKLISYANININNKIVASVSFNYGDIWKYELQESDKKIKGEIFSKITRKVKSEIDGKISEHIDEITEDKYELLQSDYKRLFRQL